MGEPKRDGFAGSRYQSDTCSGHCRPLAGKVDAVERGYDEGYKEEKAKQQ
jgi:hypothetical protein